MPELKFSLLGPPRIELEGALLRFDSRKIVALAAYLAVTGEIHSREALITLLWPELEPSRARAGLRRNLSILKKALKGQWLIADRETIGTDPSSNFWMDVTRFRTLLRAWQRHDHPRSGPCSECVNKLAEAVQLYRGEFLEGFSLPDSPNFDEWQFFQTESLRQEMADALEELVRGYAAQGAYKRAIPYSRRWLALDPLHEPAHRHLMRLYAWSGQRAAALRQYAECERLLEEELDVSPERETTQLFEAIREKRELALPMVPRVAESPTDTLNNRYRLEEELGRGNMGVVYRAHDLLLDREVAIKTYSPARLGVEGRARLLEEAQAAAKLNHPNIVSLYDMGEASPMRGVGQEVTFTVMELVEGKSLHDHHLEAIDDILVMAGQVCAALEHAHGHGIVHRDLKPENIIIASDGTAKLTDFGLARPVASRVTSKGDIVGTVFYLAPELALGQRFDGRADLYALGVILYELTTGRLPFVADDAMAVISQHLYAPVVPPRTRNIEIPPALDALIVRLLSKEPQDRPATATEVLHLLTSPEMLDKAAVSLDETMVLRRIEVGRLVGREQDLWEARDLWGRVLSGQGQVLLVSGEAGIGKTRLVHELATHVRVSGGLALAGACYAEGGPPYGPFSLILRQAFESEYGQELDLPEFVLDDLLVLAPALRLNYPDIRPAPGLDDPKAEQLRLFESLVIFFQALSSGLPLLLIVEDIHWADSGTLSLLRQLARQTRQARLLIVATFRSVELEGAPALHEMLLDLSRERLATQVELPRLDREQTGQMLALLLAEEITPAFLNGIYRETEGNPFFVEEVCKALVESGKLTFSGGRWNRPSMRELGIPQSVQVAIQSRVRVLPALTQETLRLAAVLGRDFAFETLVEASAAIRSGDELEEVVIEALEDAARAQLIRQISAERGGTFSFVHVLIPTTLVESMRTLERRRLHGQAAAAMEVLHPDDFEALAHHFTQAGNLEKAAGYLLQAGDRARGLYAHPEAIANYQRALEYLTGLGDMEQVARTQMKLGLTYHNAFDFAAARRAFEEAFVLEQKVAKRDSSSQVPPPPHALRVTALEPTTLNTSIAMDFTAQVITDQIFSGLVEVGPEMNVIPDVAHSWEVQEGGRRYLFHLRDDALWSDGQQVTAGDFEYAWNWPYPPLGMRVSYMHYLLGSKGAREGESADPEQFGVHALDNSTLAVELDEPISYLPYLLSFAPSYPVPRHMVEAHGAAWADLDNLVTNGPFELSSWEPGQGLVLERNPAYHGRFTGNLQRVECTFISGRTAEALQMYGEDRLDICYGLFPTEWERARERYAGEYVSGPWLSTDFVGFDVSRPPFDDQRVRKALALATDREALAHLNLRGYAFPATGGMVPPEMPGHSPSIGLPYDPEAARHLLAEAGYAGGRGFPGVSCLVRDDPGHDLLYEYLRAQWRESLGLEISWEESTWAQFPSRLSEESPHLWIVGWYADYPDPDNYLRIQWWTSPDWHNSAYDRLVERAQTAVDQEERMKMYQEAERILVEEVPLLPLCYGRFHLLMKPWVRRFFTSPFRWWTWKDVVLEPH